MDVVSLFSGIGGLDKGFINAVIRLSGRTILINMQWKHTRRILITKLCLEILMKSRLNVFRVMMF